MKDVAEQKLAFKAKLDQLIAIAKKKKGILEQELKGNIIEKTGVYEVSNLTFVNVKALLELIFCMMK